MIITLNFPLFIKIVFWIVYDKVCATRAYLPLARDPRAVCVRTPHPSTKQPGNPRSHCYSVSCNPEMQPSTSHSHSNAICSLQLCYPMQERLHQPCGARAKKAHHAATANQVFSVKTPNTMSTGTPWQTTNLASIHEATQTPTCKTKWTLCKKYDDVLQKSSKII